MDVLNFSFGLDVENIIIFSEVILILLNIFHQGGDYETTKNAQIFCSFPAELELVTPLACWKRAKYLHVLRCFIIPSMNDQNT